MRRTRGAGYIDDVRLRSAGLEIVIARAVLIGGRARLTIAPLIP
jgi:hypothetical protein